MHILLFQQAKEPKLKFEKAPGFRGPFKFKKSVQFCYYNYLPKIPHLQSNGQS